MPTHREPAGAGGDRACGRCVSQLGRARLEQLDKSLGLHASRPGSRCVSLHAVLERAVRERLSLPIPEEERRPRTWPSVTQLEVAHSWKDTEVCLTPAQGSHPAFPSFRTAQDWAWGLGAAPASES